MLYIVIQSTLALICRFLTLNIGSPDKVSGSKLSQVPFSRNVSTASSRSSVPFCVRRKHKLALNDIDNGWCALLNGLSETWFLHILMMVILLSSSLARSQLFEYRNKYQLYYRITKIIILVQSDVNYNK